MFDLLCSICLIGNYLDSFPAEIQMKTSQKSNCILCKSYTSAKNKKNWRVFALCVKGIIAKCWSHKQIARMRRDHNGAKTFMKSDLNIFETYHFTRFISLSSYGHTNTNPKSHGFFVIGHWMSRAWQFFQKLLLFTKIEKYTEIWRMKNCNAIS